MEKALLTRADKAISDARWTLQDTLNKVTKSDSDMKDIVLEKYVSDLEMISVAMKGIKDNVLGALEGFEVAEVVDEEG